MNTNFKTFLAEKKNAVIAASATVVTTGAAVVPALAAVDPPSAAITTEMLEPIITGITANIGVILPVGIAVFAIMIGVALVPKLIKRFTKG